MGATMGIRILKATPCMLVLLFLIPEIQGICPLVCLCSGNDRNVDCSSRNLTVLPQELQDNVTHLNLSYNHFVDLNHQLTQFAHLRTLDLSHNWLPNLPTHLPRSLWEIYATHNKIKILQKLDTAYQWNLKVLDVSDNVVERAVLINNTMSSLTFLNLSHNKLWTLPTNIPYNTETVDLSNNFLTQILPGTLERLPRLSRLYLHNNKFAYIPDRAFDQLVQLQLITLYGNPWACANNSLSYLQKWVGKTTAVVLGWPCSDVAITPWKEATMDVVSPTAAENPLLVKAMKAARTTKSPGTMRQTKLEHQQFKTKDANLGATVGQTVAFTSTDRPLVLHPEEGNTETLSLHEAAAIPHTIYMQDTSSGNSSTRGLLGSLATPMTLSITSGMPTNSTKPPQSTTTVKKGGSASKIKPRVPSKENVRKGDLFLVVMLAVAAVETNNGFVLK